MKAIELALAACRKRQSPRTGFVHYFPGTTPIHDTIPLYENFCFALALFRQNTALQVLEGKELLERLLRFEVNGNFPVYLHDYPLSWDRLMPLKVAPILVALERRYAAFLGEELVLHLKRCLERLLTFVEGSREKKGLLPLWEERYKAWKKELYQPMAYETAEEWFEGLVSAEMAGIQLTSKPPFALNAFAGVREEQEGFEPKPAAIEWVLAEEMGQFSERLLKDHPLQMHAAVLWPIEKENGEEKPWVFIRQGKGFRLLWQGAHLHSLTTQGPLEEASLTGCLFTLDKAPVFDRDDLIEVAFHLNVSQETNVFVNGKKATAFRLGDEVLLQTPSFAITLRFETEGGEFMGQISKANRPGQTVFGIYDWQIALRTLRREDVCKVHAHLAFS